MPKPDTIGVYQGSTWDRVPANGARTSAPFDVADGDLLVVHSGAEQNDTSQSITIANNGAATTWNVLASATSGTPNSSTFLRAWSTVITGGARVGMTVTTTILVGTGNATGVIVFHYRNHGGTGAVATRIGTQVASAVDLTVPGVTANAAINWFMGDWAAITNTTPTYRTTDAGAITQRVNFTNGLAWTAIAADHADAGVAGAKHVGFTQSADWTMIAVEVKGTAAASAPVTGQQHSPRGGQAVQRAATWCKKRSGILVPDLWLPSPAGI